MFWKKRPIDSIVLAYETNCKREAFRYHPPSDAPLILIVNDRVVDIVNISASGVGFKNDGFKGGDRHNAHLAIPGQDRHIEAGLIIRFIDGLDICHCEFDNMTLTDTDCIHQYIFECQMNTLRNRSK